MSKIVFLEPMDNYEKKGKHVVLINNEDVSIYVDGKNLTVEVTTPIIAVEDGRPKVLEMTAKATTKLLDGDKFRIKLGIRTAYAKAMKQLINSAMHFYVDMHVGNMVKEYNETVSNIKAYDENHLDYIQELSVSCPMKGKARKRNSK